MYDCRSFFSHENQNEEEYCIKVVMSDTENKLLNQE